MIKRHIKRKILLTKKAPSSLYLSAILNIVWFSVLKPLFSGILNVINIMNYYTKRVIILLDISKPFSVM